MKIWEKHSRNSWILNLKVAKIYNVEDGWNNFRKTICEVADIVLGKSAMTETRNISEKALGLIE